ncbi:MULTISPECIES: AAC(3) family N-acetyltransferase [unclassified Fusibacter]|uniref:AAC(3) family N-acetyltransferase n=1 Tax=unclassified Fusibacter TaxID=2624464 RepID=UPI001011AAFC|nr:MULTISPECIES: AAC(3) family N-acetyltransferase [unclassified Fusibacter]MCK8058656.1 AAC(3) family N-acetyltransferase [Fusibacter sp. A2]NPE21731.1 AAC(3) family N-acetyltransferase [Fusibacter sp. A1]RXV61305.1 aminoglycoside N(3)-acetyltransferase [Fusibacter sp. A1]
MRSKGELISQLVEMGLEPTDVVMIHSSMKAIGEVEGGAQGVLDVLMDYFKEGLLLLPTHTWATVIDSQPVYNPATEPSCVGILSNLFLKRDKVYRSLHPTHSVAAFGRDAKAYVQGEERFHTPCPREGCWGRLVDRRAKLLFIGATLKTNTFIHGIEEWMMIPQRLSASTHTMYIDLKDRRIEKHMNRHDTPGIDVSKQYDKVEPLLLARGAATIGRFGQAKTYVLDAVRTYELVSSLLKEQPDTFAHVGPLENWEHIR